MSEPLTYEEAKRRTVKCNNHLVPAQDEDGNWYCARCKVTLKKMANTKIGFRHRYVHPEGATKMCSQEDCEADNPQPIENFYTKHTTMDELSAACRKCTQKRERERRDELNNRFYKRSLWIPKDLLHAIDRVRGRQSIGAFVIQALRAETERRAREIMIEQARINKDKDKPQWIRRLTA